MAAHAMKDYAMQLRLLENQNRQRLALKREEKTFQARARAFTSRIYPPEMTGSSSIGMRQSSPLGDNMTESANEEDSDSLSSTNHSGDSTASSEEEKKKSRKAKSRRKDAAKKNSEKSGIEQLASLLAANLPKERSAAANDTLNNYPLYGGSSATPAPYRSSSAKLSSDLSAADIAEQVVQLLKRDEDRRDGKKRYRGKPGSKVAFKRVDHVYDHKTYNFKLQETVDSDPKRDQWDQYIFNVRREFDMDKTHLATMVDIKSQNLRDCLKEIMADIKGINLITEKPAIVPNMLFLYLEELRDLQTHYLTQSTTLENKKEKKTAKLNSQHLEVLVRYLDEDFAETKKALYPMLEAGIITYDYLWALFKPNTILYSSTYDDEEEPRASKTVSCKEITCMTGKCYIIQSSYLDYDGKKFGTATDHTDIFSFSGSKPITSLPCYPIHYHKNAESAKQELIERGKRFVALQGMNYKMYAGMAYLKKEKQILKVDVHGRVMVDPAIFRRINPNYALSKVSSMAAKGRIDEDDPILVDDMGYVITSSDGRGHPTPTTEDLDKHKHFKVSKNEDGRHVVTEIDSEEAAQISIGDSTQTMFTEEQLLTANSVVAGFSFSEKLWLEFAVSKVGEIRWNTDAFDSLILPDSHKNIVKAMVSSHAFHPSRSIDDIIAGKGRGLVAVLHGGPGLGKTLTVESIADLLKRPLYTVSAGELGTDGHMLERELQEILDIAHAWGAVLLLDEADVFLEKRSTHDIHRNALVSIFLRLLEYFQGILFLTTNRVEVFDDAFVSRIHLSLRYNELSTKAKKAVWTTFINKVRDAEGMQVEGIEEKDLDDLSRRALNGRQIKNIVRAAQALAIHEDVALGLAHIRNVLEVTQTFERDLKGGPGYEDAMRGYT